MNKEQVNLKLNSIEAVIDKTYENIRNTLGEMKRANGYSLDYIYDTYRTCFQFWTSLMRELDVQETILFSYTHILEYKSEEYNRTQKLIEKIRNIRSENVHF